MSSLGQHVKRDLPAVEIVQERSVGFRRSPIGDFEEKIKVVGGASTGVKLLGEGI